MTRIDEQAPREIGDERMSIVRPVAVIAAILRDQVRLGPERDVVLAPPAAIRPARQRFPGVPLALPKMKQSARREAIAQTAQQRIGAEPFRRPECRSIP